MLNMKNQKLKKRLSIVLCLSMLLSIILINPITTSAYVSTIGNVISTTAYGDNITITVDNGLEANDDILELQVCETDILKVNYRPNGINSSSSTPMIDPNRTWGTVGAQINVNSDPMTIVTSDMRVEIKKNPCRMTVKKSDGTTLFWEPDSAGVFYDGVRFQRNPNHNMYGIHSYECFDGNGEIIRNNTTHAAQAGQQGNSGGPFIWSTAGYGLLVDSDGGYSVLDSSTNKMEFYYGSTTEEGRRYFKGNVEYYVMLGEPEEIMDNFSHITGQSPMMPEWSLGFSNYEWGINQQELYQMVDTYRAKDIPIDSFGIDYDWKRYGEDNYGEFTWNTSNYPDAESTTLKNNLLADGIRMIGITKPRIVTKLDDGTSTVQGLDATAGGYFYPGHAEYTDYFYPVTVQSIDPYKPETRAWWWNHSIDAFDKGIAGWWNDETDTVSSGGANYWFGNFTTLHLSQGLYEGQRSYTNDSTRVWQTARNFYPGTQRYGTTIWSGDVGTQFIINENIGWTNGLNDQKATMLSTINNGQMKWGSDGGGFNQKSGTIENPSPELYTRWLQLAALSPVFRVHGNFNHQRQPWYYGFTAEENSKAAIQLRYSLLPYIYSYEFKALDKGVGLVKPLMFDYPNDPNVANYSDAWMFGDWLLAAPVTQRYETTKWIYLPEGNWIDYFTGMVYQGGQYIPYFVNGESWTDIPLFVKEGAIIPTQKVLDYTDAAEINEIMMDVFPHTSLSTFDFYDDDGTSYNYENGVYFKQTISVLDNGANEVNVSISDNTGTYLSPVNTYIIKIHGKAAQNVAINGGDLSQYSSLFDLRNATGEGFAVGKDIYGDVTYVKVASGAEKNITVTGSSVQTATGTYYEAEEASLWGDTTTTQAKSNNNHANYTGFGFVDKLENDGSAVTFRVNAKTPGEYPVDIRFSNGSATNKTLSVFVNGSFIRQVEFGTTANWDTWNIITEYLPLAAGGNSITLQVDMNVGDTGYLNIDNLLVPFCPTISYYEAESAALHNGPARATNHWYYKGSGFVGGIENVGSEVEFKNVIVPSAGTYEVNLRYANGNSDTKTLNVYVNGIFNTTANLSSLGSDWNLWGTWTQNMQLNQGQNRISFKFDTGNSGYVNLDNLEVEICTPTNMVEKNILDNGGFERPTWESSNWTEWHPDGQILSYGVDKGIGMNPPEAAREGEQRAYFYLASAYQQSIHQVNSVSNGSYRLEFWAKNFNTTPSIARAEIATQGQSTIYVNINQSSEWTHYVVDNITLNSIVDIGFYVNSPGGTTFHIDGVRLIPLN